MGTVGSVVQGIASSKSPGTPASVETNWVVCHDDLEATADAASVFLKPWNSAKTSFHWVKVPDNCTRVLVRGKVSAAATTIATAPIVMLVGAMGADPSTSTNNFTGTHPTSAQPQPNFAKYIRLDNVDQDAAGVTLTLNVTTNGFEDNTYVYGNPYDLDGFDCKGARYVGLMVLTAASVTGGSANLALAEFAFLN